MWVLGIESKSLGRAAALTSEPLLQLYDFAILKIRTPVSDFSSVGCSFLISMVVNLI